MAQAVLSHCDCCGLAVNLAQVEVCPACQYPVNPDKERQFLESALHDLRRVMRYGGAAITVADLVRRYERRLQFLVAARKAQVFAPRPGPINASMPVFRPQPSFGEQGAPPGAPAANIGQAAPPPMQGVPPPVFASAPAHEVPPPVAPRPRGFSFSGDAVVNILATLGGFLLLAGSLSFVLTMPDLRVSFLGVFLLHAVFGGVGLFTRRRFPHLRTVSTLYTLIFALLVPLVAFSAYRLVTNNLLELSPSSLLVLAALYAAAVYGLLGVVQRFVPFAYLGVVSLLVADLALAQSLHLAYWWWPSLALLLALLVLFVLSGPPWLLAEGRALFRTPLKILMYAVVWSSALVALLMLLDSLSIDVIEHPVREAHRALFVFSGMLFAWSGLWIWRMRRTRWTPLLVYLFLAVVLLLGYMLNINLSGYILLLAGVALFYHVLARVAGDRLTRYGLSGLALDWPAIGLVILVLLLTSFATPLQLLYRAYPGSPIASPLVTFDLLALNLCLLVTLDITFARAGLSKVPAKAKWCWLLVLSGLVLAAIYGQLVLFWSFAPFWSLLIFSAGLLLGTVATRRFTSSAWSNPLDVLTLSMLIFTLLLSFGQAQDVVSASLCGSAAVLYLVLLYQRRPLPTPICAALLLLALLSLLNHPIFIFGLGLLLPLLVVGMQSAGLFGEKAMGRQRLFAWTLLLPALFYGLALAIRDINYSQGVLANFHIAPVYEIAALGTSWYAAALIARARLWLIPAALFWVLAMLLPTNDFWVLSILTPCLALLAAFVDRRITLTWALPLYLTALFGVGMVAYTGVVHQHVTAASWILLGFALLAYGIGLFTDHVVALWLTPLIAIPAVFLAAGIVGDLYRPPLTVLACVGLGLAFSRSTLPILVRLRRRAALLYTLPFYTTALAAALLTGIYGVLGDINRPFYGALPLALLLYALLAFAVLLIERQPLWNWLVAVFACWSVLLLRQLTVPYVLGVGTGLIFLGVLCGSSLLRRLRANGEGAVPRTLASFRWSWPWYSAFLLASLVLGVWPTLPGQANSVALGLLVFTVLAAGVMLIERVPEFLPFPAGLAALAIARWLPAPGSAPLLLAYTSLCMLIFFSQFTWRAWPPVTRWLPATSLHNLLSLGGLCLVVLASWALGALSPAGGFLDQTGILALATLSALLLLYGWTHLSTVAYGLPQQMDEMRRAQRLGVARAVQHWSFYAAGLLLALVASWELLAFYQTRFDVLTLVPASYLIVLAPFLLRDQALPRRHVMGQLVALVGAALLLLPSLWLSFAGVDLLSTLILLVEALVLLVLGLVMRLRIFILSSAALIVVGTLRLLFLTTSTSVPILLMAFGSVLIVFATALILSRRRLQVAWRNWE